MSVNWRDVETRHVFSLLAPLYGKVCFPPRNRITDRFDRYSAKVLTLRFAVFDQLALGRRRLDFLPNLVTLYDPQPTPLLTYSNMKCLVFDWPVIRALHSAAQGHCTPLSSS